MNRPLPANLICTIVLAFGLAACYPSDDELLEPLHGEWEMDIDGMIEAMPEEKQDEARMDVAHIVRAPRLSIDSFEKTLTFYENEKGDSDRFEVISSTENVIRIKFDAKDIMRIIVLDDGRIRMIDEDEEAAGRFVDQQLLFRRIP